MWEQAMETWRPLPSRRAILRRDKMDFTTLFLNILCSWSSQLSTSILALEVAGRSVRIWRVVPFSQSQANSPSSLTGRRLCMTKPFCSSLVDAQRFINVWGGGEW